MRPTVQHSVNRQHARSRTIPPSFHANMQLSLILLSTLAALAQSTFAARLPLDQPGSPRSSVQGATEAKAAYRRRQAQSADIVRRLKTGPNRKRQE